MEKPTTLDPFDVMESVTQIETVDDIGEDNIELDIDTSPAISDTNDSESAELPPVKNTESTEDYDVEIVGNPIYVIAKKWKESGRLPEDFEVTEEMSEDSFDAAFYKLKEDTVIGDLRSKVLDELMINEGLTPEAIETAKLIHFGVQNDDIIEASTLNSLGTVELDDTDPDYEKYVEELGKQYYSRKGFSAEKASKYVARDLDDDDISNVAEEYQTYFKTEAANKYAAIRDKADTAKRKAREAEENEIAEINRLLTSGIIDGTQYSKEDLAAVKKAIFEKTELIIDKSGNKRFVSLEQKKILDSKNNTEKKLKNRIDFILGVDRKKLATDATLKASNLIRNELASLVKVTPKTIKAQAEAAKAAIDKEIDIEL